MTASAQMGSTTTTLTPVMIATHRLPTLSSLRALPITLAAFAIAKAPGLGTLLRISALYVVTAITGVALNAFPVLPPRTLWSILLILDIVQGVASVKLVQNGIRTQMAAFAVMAITTTTLILAILALAIQNL